MKYRVGKTENGFEVWGGVAFENPSIAFSTRVEAKVKAEEMNRSIRERYADEPSDASGYSEGCESGWYEN